MNLQKVVLKDITVQACKELTGMGRDCSLKNPTVMDVFFTLTVPMLISWLGCCTVVL